MQQLEKRRFKGCWQASKRVEQWEGEKLIHTESQTFFKTREHIFAGISVSIYFASELRLFSM
jgi:hypothetical protein